MSDVPPPAAAQPPAGWYPDPSDAAQQRYWDGSTWTGHTAASGAGAAMPTGADPMAGAALPSGAPAWQMPMGGAPAGPKKSWWKLKRVWIPALVVVALIVLVAVFGTSDHSNALEQSIKTTGQQQLQAGFQQRIPGATVVITKVHCVEKGSSQTYDCLIDYTVTDPSNGDSQKFFQDANGSCDSSSTCLWHTTEDPQVAPE